MKKEQTILSQIASRCYLLLLFSFISTAVLAQTNTELEKKRQAYEKSMNEHQFNNRPNMSRKQWKAIPKQTRPDLAWEQDFLLTKDPKTGKVPSEKRIIAMERAREMLKNKARLRTEAAIAGVNWIERGPNNVGGSTRALMFDPNDNTNKKIWAGVAGGGLWYTNDVTVSKPTWVKVDDFWDNLAVSWIAAAPNKTDFYVGTGEGWNGGSSIPGAGIWKSSNAGTNWARLPSTANNPDFNQVLTIVVTGTGQGTILAGTGTGLFRSTDGGATWARTLNPAAEPYNSNRVTDIEVASNGHIYASLGIQAVGRVVKSTDGGLTWTLLTAFPAASPQRLQMAVSPNNPNVLYVAAQGSTATLLPGGGVFRTTDGGTTWQTLATPISAEDGKDGASQAWIHLTLTVDPNNDNHVILGGMDLYRTTNGGTSWTQISKWSNNGGLRNLTCSIVHADHTNTMFVPGSSTSLLSGNDGGVYYTTDLANAATRDVFRERNNGYNVTQFYAGAINPTLGSNNFLAGAQDNGTQRFNMPGVASTTEATGGDGGYCFIDQDQPTIQITSYTNNNYYLSQDGGSSFPQITTNNDGSFINPTDYEDRENILYSGRDANSIQRITGIGGTRTVTAVTLAINTEATHFKVSPYSAAGTSTVFIGTQGGRVFKATNAQATPALADITGDLAATGSVSCIEIGASEDELLLTLSNYGVKSVWLSKNGGTNWVSKDETVHGLPDIPVRWALFNPKNRNQVLLATEVGVWSTDNINDANPGWQPTNNGLANTRISMFKYRASDGIVLAVTYGRGLYTTDVFADPRANFDTPNLTWFANRPLRFFDRSLKANSWSWNFGGGGATNSTAQNPTATYTTAGTYSVALTVNGGGNANLTRTIQVTILPEPTIPYFNDFNANGGGFTASVQRGSGEWQWGAATANKGNLNPGNNFATIEGAGNWMTNLNTHMGFNTQYSLDSPPFNTNGLPPGDYLLTFDYRALFVDVAGFNVQYSVDGGNNWTILGSVGDANGTNWYNNANIQGIGGIAGWTTTDFNTVFKPSYKISAVAGLWGQTDVRFRFFTGAPNRTFDGVQIDNFRISAPTATTPVVNTYLPAINVNAVARNTNLVLTFDRNMVVGTGNIVIKQPVGGATKETISVNSANVRVQGNIVTITPANVLDIGATTEVIVDAGAFKDLGNNNSAAIPADFWKFTISNDANTPPTLNTIANSATLKEDAGEQTVALTGISSGDGPTQAVNFTVTTISSDNQDLLPNGNITINYSNPANTAELKYTTAKNKNGTANVTVTITDAGGLSLVRTFAVNVTKTNDAPRFAAPPAAPPVEQGAPTQVIDGFASDIDDGDEDEEQELNFVVTVKADGRQLDDEVEVFDEIDIDPETGRLTYTLLPNVKGEITVSVQLFDSGEGEDPSQRTEGSEGTEDNNDPGGDDNSSPVTTFKLNVVTPGTLPNTGGGTGTNPNDPKKPITVLGIEDLEESNRINLYPNPNTGKFMLKYVGKPTTKVLSLYITNIAGQVVYQGMRTNFTQTYEGEIDINDMTNGVYIVSIVSDKEVFRKRLVINK